MDQKQKQQVENAKKTAVWENESPIGFSEFDKVVRKWLEIVDFGITKAVLAFIVANRLPGNSVWALLVGASGSGKTEFISGLNYMPYIHTLSNLTPNTFISGQRGVEGLLNQLDGKILAFKDFTTILEMNSDARNEIMSQLREIYDGYYEKSFGTGENKVWKGKMGFIAGVTTIVDIREQQYAALGERFIKYRIMPPDRMTIARKALANTTMVDIMQDDIKTAFARCLKGVEAVMESGEKVTLTDEQKEKLVRLSNFATLARSPVTRDFGMTKEVIYKPASEMPTRFTQQLSQIAIALKIINRANGQGDDLMELDEKILFKIALDSIPHMRREFLQKLAAQPTVTTEQMSEMTNYPTNTARRYLEDLFVLEICNRRRGDASNQDEKGGSHIWELRQTYRDLLMEFDGVKVMTEEDKLKEIAELEAADKILAYDGVEFPPDEINPKDLGL